MYATQSLQPMPGFGRVIAGIGALFPLLIGLGLRMQGRLAHWTWARDIVSGAVHAGLIVWFAGIFFFAVPLN